MLNPGRLGRGFLICFAALAAFLFLTLPALCQESQQEPSRIPAAPPAQDKPKDQWSAPDNSKDQSSETQEETAKSKDDRMFYVMPNYLTVENESEIKPVSWKESSP